MGQQKKIEIQTPTKEVKSQELTNLKRPSGNQPIPSTKTNISFK